ncbi:DnaJ domain-containing protein [Usnea florida]
MSHLALFHTSSAWRSESTGYYEALGLDSNASAADIKRQFYSLSKTHHPDHNPNDPKASDRFVKISEAYAILGSPQKRERYDQDFQRAQGVSPFKAPRGSHSSSSTAFGSRPASGLSRRRTQFKGPPPSFYRSGGWGAQGNKRKAQAEESQSTGTGEVRGGGFGTGQGQAGFDDVPHFDREGHYRTQEQQDQRRRRRTEGEGVGFVKRGDVFSQFLMISALVTFAFSIPTLFDRGRNGRKKDEG